MSYQSDALSWLTVVRNRQHQSATNDDRFLQNPSSDHHFNSCIIKPTPNRWLMESSPYYFNENENNNNNENNVGGSSSNNKSFRASNSGTMMAMMMVQDDERDKETKEMMNERERRRSHKWKTLLLQRAPPQNPCEPVPSMAYGFDAIDTRSFQSSIAQLFSKNVNNNNNRNNTRKTSFTTSSSNNNNNASSSLAHEAFSNVEQKQQHTLMKTNNNHNSGNSLFRISDEGLCIAHGLKTIAEVDYVIHQLQKYNAQQNIITSIDVSNSKAFQQFETTDAGPLMKKIIPLAFIRDDCPWLRISVLIADNCDLHDFDADFISEAIREPSCALERISVKNNVITEKGADRFKKAVKYNNRILHVELNGNPCTHKPSEKTRQILNQLEDRLNTNRKKKIASGGR